MTQRQALVAANWKMNGSLASIAPLLQQIVGGLPGPGQAGGEVAVCAPYIYIPRVAELLAQTEIALGAQNLSAQAVGAYTGEISAAMLKDYDCRYVIVGHSERRSLYAESDGLVADKFAAAQAAGLIPILCLGEQLHEREQGSTEEIVARQLDAVIERCDIAGFTHAVIAYEPVWAIGTGLTATPEQAQEAHAFIRLRLARHDDAIADTIRILYGGSVKADNAGALFSMADVDGGLIGGASLDAQDFLTICHAAGQATAHVAGQATR